jgi:transposase-like protein
LAAIKGDRTISQVAAHYEIHVNLVAHWKKQRGQFTVCRESCGEARPG